jgi:hypothetical protein
MAVDYPYGKANLQGFADFLTNNVQVPVKALAVPVVSDYMVGAAFEVAKCTVDPIIQRVSPIYYTMAMYNFATDWLINNAVDLDCETYWEKLRAKWNINGPISGVVESTADESTSTSLKVPEVFNNLSPFDLQLMKTPWGRAYMGIASKFADIWGVS